ncbi:NHL repeat-containing protein [Dyella agri]|uniref:NHL repeat-containing protein n=1 Tax=Dyella agri TaxID=1926869 RepID=A0ABW8KDH4_9GAMM
MASTSISVLITRRLALALVVAGMAAGGLQMRPAFAQTDGGNILVADQFNNRVVEINRQTHQVVWHFGNGSDLPGPHSVVGTNDAERFGTFTLISGTGTPPGLPGCGDTVNGCPDNRVFIVDHYGDIIWQYGQAGVAGAGPDQLNTPVQALFLVSFPGRYGPHVLIADQANQRIILVNLRKQVVWQYGATGVSGNGPGQLNNPNSAEVLTNGHILIADENNNRVIEITPAGKLVKTFTAQGTVSGAAFASRLPNGHTLITDSNNNRIVEVDGNDKPVWQYFTNTEAGSNPTPLPTRAVRLRNGHTLISDQFNDRVIEVDMLGKTVFTQGGLNTPGSGYDQLNGPYDAKQIGDFTGLTPPFGD